MVWVVSCTQVTGEGARMGLKSGLTPLAKPHALVCRSTEGAFVQSVHSEGLLFLIYLPRGTPFSSVCLPAGGPLSNLHNGVLYVKGGCACDKPLLTLCSELEHGMSGGLLQESFTPGWVG